MNGGCWNATSKWVLWSEPGAPAFVIADTRVVKVVFGVPDTMIQRIRLGDLQRISTLTFPGEIPGRVTSISPSADPKSRVFSVEVSIANADNRLKPGMIATLALGNEKACGQARRGRGAAERGGSFVQDWREFAVFVIAAECRGKSGRARARREGGRDTIGNNIAVTAGPAAGRAGCLRRGHGNSRRRTGSACCS